MATFVSRVIRPVVLSAPTQGLLADAAMSTTVAVTDGQSIDVIPEPCYVVLTVIFLLGGFGLGTLLHHTAFIPAQGFSGFAVMYIVAQVIERLQEPFVPWMGRAKSDACPARVIQSKAKALRDQAVMDARTHPTDEKMAKEAARSQRTVDQIRSNLTLFMWGTSAALAMLASGLFGLYLLKAVGVQKVPICLDIALTGLAIGGGTKPLHDLISNISEAKTAKQDPIETA